MKYLKQFENNIYYNVGDYVVVDSDWLENVGKIVGVNPNYYDGGKTDYMFETYEKVTKDKMKHQITITDKDIIRKATPEEIEKLIIQKDLDKYNI